MSKSNSIYEMAAIKKLERIIGGESSPGFAISVSKEGVSLGNVYMGNAVMEHNIPLGEKTRFHVASLAKQFTAFSVALLIEKNELALDDLAINYLPNMPILNSGIVFSWMMSVRWWLALINSNTIRAVLRPARIHENNKMDASTDKVAACSPMGRLNAETASISASVTVVSKMGRVRYSTRWSSAVLLVFSVMRSIARLTTVRIKRPMK